MALRSIWNGTVAFGGVFVLVKVHSATEDRTVHFHQVHQDDGARIEHKRICSKEDKEVPYKEIVKGFEVSSGKYVVLEDDKNVFPPYNITFAVRDEVADKLGTEGQKVITDVQKYMTAEIMQELNARVDLDKQERDKVAADYLKQFGFTS